MTEFLLKENVLTDNILKIADDGKVFKGNYIAIIIEYTFLNSWSDQKHIKRFRNQESLNNYLNKNYPEFAY